MYEKFVRATGKTIITVINDRNHPIDFADRLIDYKLLMILVCGEVDTVVPYLENGVVSAQKEYRDPFVEVVNPDCNHHPHGLVSQEELISFATQFY